MSSSGSPSDRTEPVQQPATPVEQVTITAQTAAMQIAAAQGAAAQAVATHVTAAAQSVAAQVATVAQAAAGTQVPVSQAAPQPAAPSRPAYKRAGVRVSDLSADAQEAAIGRYQQYLFDAQIKFSEVLSAAIVTLSGGSLVISITFIEKIVGAGNVKFVPVLFLGWGSFIIAILCALFGLQLGVQVLRADLAAFHGQDIEARRYPNLIGYLRLGATTAITCGFILLAGFAFVNATKDENKKESESVQPASSRNSPTAAGSGPSTLAGSVSPAGSAMGHVRSGTATATATAPPAVSAASP